MRNDPHMRCIALVERAPEIQDAISQFAFMSNTEVVYVDNAAEEDDLDYVDRVQAFADNYKPEEYRYHCGSLWARRGQDLLPFWHIVQNAMGESFSTRVPKVFCDTDTFFNPLYD